MNSGSVYVTVDGHLSKDTAESGHKGKNVCAEK